MNLLNTIINDIANESAALPSQLCAAVSPRHVEELKTRIPLKATVNSTKTLSSFLGELICGIAIFIRDNPSTAISSRSVGRRGVSVSVAETVALWLLEAKTKAQNDKRLAQHLAKTQREADILAGANMTTSNRKLKLPSQTGQQHHGKAFQHALIPERKHQMCIVCKHDSINVIKTSATLTLPHQKQKKKKQKRVGADNYIDENDEEGDDDDDDNEVQSGSKTTFLCFCYEFHSHGQPDGGQCPHCITSYAETGHLPINCAICNCTCRASYPLAQVLNLTRNIAVHEEMLKVAQSSTGFARAADGPAQWQALLKTNSRMYDSNVVGQHSDNLFQANLSRNDSAARAVHFMTNFSGSVDDGTRHGMQQLLGVPTSVIHGRNVNSFGNYPAHTTRHYRNNFPDSVFELDNLEDVDDKIFENSGVSSQSLGSSSSSSSFFAGNDSNRSSLTESSATSSSVVIDLSCASSVIAETASVTVDPLKPILKAAFTKALGKFKDSGAGPEKESWKKLMKSLDRVIQRATDRDTLDLRLSIENYLSVDDEQNEDTKCSHLLDFLV